MKYIIVFLFTIILSCGLTMAVGYPGNSDQHSFLEGTPTPLPSSEGTAFSRNNQGPILRAGDANDTGDNINNTGGEDYIGNVNDNNVPIRGGILIISLIAIAYTIALAVKKRRKMRNSSHR